MAAVVEALMSNPGLYLGSQQAPEDTSGHRSSAARVNVSVLPGRTGVMMEYEVISPTNGLVHHEHAVLARTMAGTVLVTSHTHADVTTVISETEPGYFPATEEDSPFPMAIRLEVPEPGHLIYSWSYGGQGQPLKVRDVGDLRLVT